VSTRIGSGSIKLKGTNYYACGTINVAATLRSGKRGAVAGDGSITGGTGNYQGLQGTFTITGKLNPRTNRGMLVLKGSATY
jgi:hypothetical protein